MRDLTSVFSYLLPRQRLCQSGGGGRGELWLRTAGHQVQGLDEVALVLVVGDVEGLFGQQTRYAILVQLGLVDQYRDAVLVSRIGSVASLRQRELWLAGQFANSRMTDAAHTHPLREGCNGLRPPCERTYYHDVMWVVLPSVLSVCRFHIRRRLFAQGQERPRCASRAPANQRPLAPSGPCNAKR